MMAVLPITPMRRNLPHFCSVEIGAALCAGTTYVHIWDWSLWKTTGENPSLWLRFFSPLFGASCGPLHFQGLNGSAVSALARPVYPGSP